MKAGIIGAGIAGLATAVRLAARGMEVHVFEANAYPGGKLSEFRLGAYRFDAGPSLFTMPHYIEELFQVAGESMAPHLPYKQLSTVCNYFWDDQTRFSAPADPAVFAEEAARQFQVPRQRIVRLLENSQKKYEHTGRIFLEKSLHLPETWLSRSVGKALLHLPQLDIFSTMHAVNTRYLRHPKLVQLFDRYATYNGSDPYKTPGILTIIPHFEYGIGAFHPDEGMYAITRSIYELAQRKGVQFHFNTRVDAIQVADGKAIGLEVSGEKIPFDRVVSNMDVFFTYQKLLAGQKHPLRTLRQEKSTSALIFYWGIKRKFAELDLHNIFFSSDYQKEFEALRAGHVLNDPTVYVHITSKYTLADAPEYGENWFTMVNVPYNTGQDWEEIIDRTRKNILQKLSRLLHTDIASLIECEDILDPRTIESRTASHLGALYGTSSNNRMAAFMRHPNFSTDIANLYFCGGSTHPGGGIPLCLLSASITDSMIKIPVTNGH